MNKLDNSEFIGTFKIKSGQIIVSDPCYQRDNKLNIIIDNVENGNWDSYMKLNDTGQVIELYAFHSNTPKKTIKKGYWDEQDIDISVDSGQCGIFDESSYPIDVKSSFYNECCNLTQNDYAGTLNFGVVSNSGGGDGMYTCYTMEDDKIIGIKVVFIDENDNEDLYLDDKDNEDLDRYDYMDYDDINEYD